MSEERRIDDKELGKVSGGKSTPTAGSGGGHDMPGVGNPNPGQSEVGEN